MIPCIIDVWREMVFELLFSSEFPAFCSMQVCLQLGTKNVVKIGAKVTSNLQAQLLDEAFQSWKVETNFKIQSTYEVRIF